MSTKRAAVPTERISHLEGDLNGVSVESVVSILEAHEVRTSVLRSALTLREGVGRIYDLIHALTICLALPQLLAPGEVLHRPSLASGNDPSRPFDLETNFRIAEFKLSRWKGDDASRKREVFKDFVNLAADQSGRNAELYVLGPEPARFLRTTMSTAAWGMNKSPMTKSLFLSRFESLKMPISKFVTGPGSRVNIINLEAILPGIFQSIH